MDWLHWLLAAVALVGWALSVYYYRDGRRARYDRAPLLRIAMFWQERYAAMARGAIIQRERTTAKRIGPELLPQFRADGSGKQTPA
jgi:hypothetical protein